MSVADPNRDYYHINRLVPWSRYGLLSVSDEIYIGGESNPYFRFFETQRKAYPVTLDSGEVIQVPGVKFIASVSRGEINPEDLAGTALDLTKHLVAYLRELIWEDVRKREFSHLPSRQRCIWLILNQAGVRYWLRRMDVGDNFQVLRIQVQGSIHKASESYLLGDSEPMEESIEKARQYWRGVIEDAETEEIIFEGRMQVVEVMPKSFYE
jgi:hypothetical protein